MLLDCPELTNGADMAPPRSPAPSGTPPRTHSGGGEDRSGAPAPKSLSIIKVEKRGWHRATGIRTTKRPRRGIWKTVTLAPPPTFPANGSGAHPKSWCQARVLISGELPTGQRHGVARRVSASAPGCRGAGEGTWCQARVLASGGTPECPEWIWTAISQSAGNEMLRCVECTKCRVVLRAEAAAADLGFAAKRTGWCRPCGAVVSFLRLPWVSRGDTHGYSNGIPPGCSITKRPGMPDSGCGFVPEDIGGEVLTRRACPEFGGGASGGGGGSSCYRFCLGASGGCEFCRLGSRRNSRLGNLRYAWRNVVPPGRKPSPCTESTRGGEAVRQRAEIRGRRSEEEGSFVLEDVGGEWLMAQDCPELSNGADMAPPCSPAPPTARTGLEHPRPRV